jgi:hypothetical protein
MNEKIEKVIVGLNSGKEIGNISLNDLLLEVKSK